MANALTGKTLTTMTVILPNEEVAAELMDVANGHFEFMQEIYMVCNYSKLT